jgi:hypothetical protein
MSSDLFIIPPLCDPCLKSYIDAYFMYKKDDYK